MLNFIEFIKSLPGIAWPVIVAVLLWKLFPSIESIVSSRNFNVKLAGMEISVQSATEQIRTQLEDLQKQVIALRSAQVNWKGADSSALTENTTSKKAVSKKFLWVDDNPSNNALEISQLNSYGIEVVKTESTIDAMRLLTKSRGFAGIISDMGRVEGGVFVPQAGLKLLEEVRRAGISTPFIGYSSARNLVVNDQDVKAAGGDEVTSSAVRLLEWVNQILSTERAPAQ